MGCDIHGWIEIRPYPQSESALWYGAVEIGFLAERSYDMFAKLFGVRNEDNIEPIAAERGLPDDASEDAKKLVEEWSNDMHSISWISPKELKNVKTEARGWKALLEMIVVLSKHYGAQNVRMIVGFDN